LQRLDGGRDGSGRRTALTFFAEIAPRSLVDAPVDVGALVALNRSGRLRRKSADVSRSTVILDPGDEVLDPGDDEGAPPRAIYGTDGVQLVDLLGERSLHGARAPLLSLSTEAEAEAEGDGHEDEGDDADLDGLVGCHGVVRDVASTAVKVERKMLRVTIL